jgi:hypothetical protein
MATKYYGSATATARYSESAWCRDAAPDKVGTSKTVSASVSSSNAMSDRGTLKERLSSRLREKAGDCWRVGIPDYSIQEKTTDD